MRVIGTAGHVDHGKSTLVEALTGTHPDRLKEEREREMTIDLGFAWFELPNGEPVGVVDVPGHRDFIENMLAGVGGIDAALFVVAADEGVMPQTREHLAILDLLQVPGGVVALTKTDLAESDEWIDLVAADVTAALRGTLLDGAPLVRVSARRGKGLEELKQALQAQLAAVPPRADLGRPRLSIDRVFTMSGFGTVVTGTLVDGALAVGDEVEILPRGLRGRVRGLQSHKQQVERIRPGSRAAVNITGIETSDLKRGDLLTRPGGLATSRLLDVYYRHLADAGAPLKHNAEVKLFVGAAEVMARVRLLSHDTLPPGETGWLQLALAAPLAVAKGDRFILRRPSPGATLGGGQIVNAQPRRRHRRHDPVALARLETTLLGTPAEMLRQAVDLLGAASIGAALRQAGLDAEAAAEALAEVERSGGLVELTPELPLAPGSGALVMTEQRWTRLAGDLQEALAVFHATHPLRSGMSREELKNRLQLPTKVFNAVVAQAATRGLLADRGPAVSLPSHRVVFDSDQRARVEDLLAACRANPYGTPLVRDAQAQVGAEVFGVLLEQGQLVQVSDDVFFLSETYKEMVERVTAALAGGGTLTVAQVRDMFSASRKYALALMEHLDAKGVTVRRGDERALRVK
jgi:selenocysteine-specific elongation factor